MAVNAIDLCAVADVTGYLDPEGSATWSTSQQNEIQTLITAASQSWLRWTGRRTLNRILAFADTYDASGGFRQFTRDYPIISVFGVFCDGYQYPQGGVNPVTGAVTPGWVIDRERFSVSLVGVQHGRIAQSYGSFNLSGTTARRTTSMRFGTHDANNYQNLLIQYTAGNSVVDGEFWKLSGTSQQVAYGASFFADLGVMNAQTALPLVAVLANPAPGQYSVNVANGTYTFNAADVAANLQVTISYAYQGTPSDIREAVAEQVALYFKRIKTIDQKSQMIAQAGTMTLRDWHVPPAVQLVLNNHINRAQVGV